MEESNKARRGRFADKPKSPPRGPMRGPPSGRP
ncbi:hypothetical protein C5167_023523 [Papaver somniferum]|uniref:Uncharacterized protein n=1 Tax=Papaver somniferum TaxID=3469 RepID=A0A4Y7JP86_PAPSO|nr:hypothetical protein C5167_023523 [Papaver somniferum]